MKTRIKKGYDKPANVWFLVNKKKASLSTDLFIIYGNDILSQLLHKYHLRKGA